MNEHNNLMRDVFNFLIFLSLVLFTVALGNMQEAHHDDAWFVLFIPLTAFCIWWGEKVKNDYK